MLRSVRRIALTAAAVISALGACSGDDRPGPAGLGPGAGSGGRAGSAAGDAAGGTDGGGTAGATGADGSAARDGGAGSDGGSDAPPAVCGDGVAEGDEGCDGSDLREQDCRSYGFETGSLTCEACNVVFSSCSGTEHCADGRDNDGDLIVDCSDPDCQNSCADACSAPLVLPDPAVGVVGQTNGHGALITPTCLPPALSSGPEIVYRFTAAQSGVLDVQLRSTVDDLNLSVRGGCADAGSERGCSETIAGRDAVERLTLAIAQGEVVFIVVDGTGASAAGRYALDARSRTVECGDSYRDTGEECDDGNRLSDDGCSAECRLEPDESEPNGTTGEADPYTAFPFVAAIAPAGDVDLFSISVTSSGSSISAEIFDLGDGSCAKNQLDSLVAILAPDGTSVLASDDDSGDGACSVATATGVGPGTHFIRVQGASAPATFPYVLNIAVTP